MMDSEFRRKTCTSYIFWLSMVLWIALDFLSICQAQKISGGIQDIYGEKMASLKKRPDRIICLYLDAVDNFALMHSPAQVLKRLEAIAQAFKGLQGVSRVIVVMPESPDSAEPEAEIKQPLLNLTLVNNETFRSYGARKSQHSETINSPLLRS